jgi:hypothetical protein
VGIVALAQRSLAPVSALARATFMYSRVLFASVARLSAVSSVIPRSFIARAFGSNVYEYPLYSAVTVILFLLLKKKGIASGPFRVGRAGAPRQFPLSPCQHKASKL